jgi:outer membrane protein
MSVRFGLRLSAACFALLSLAKIGAAQNKVAVISLQRAVLESAEIKKADAAMQAKYKPRDDEREKISKEIESIRQNLATNAGKLTPQAEAELNARGTRRQRELQRINEDLQADVERERNEILSKSTQKMQEIIKKLAEERGLDVVVDVSNTIYFKPALDITADVLAAYNKAYPVQ